MYAIKLNGTITAKKITKVPVIRKWKLVWEMRDFGTSVEKIDKTIPLIFAEWDAIPDGGLKFKVNKDFEVMVSRAGDPFVEGRTQIAIRLMYQGAEVPGTFKIIPLPPRDVVNSFAPLIFRTNLWKGVKLEITGRLNWSP